METELREPPVTIDNQPLVEAWEPYFRAGTTPPGSDQERLVAGATAHRKTARVAKAAVQAVGPTAPSTEPMPMRRYIIDNSILQVEGRPGVAFRYTKSLRDKVRKGGPARWGEVVLGSDEGDGWLKVGDHYLPFCIQGVQVVTPVRGSAEGPKEPAAVPSRWATEEVAVAPSDSFMEALMLNPLTVAGPVPPREGELARTITTGSSGDLARIGDVSAVDGVPAAEVPAEVPMEAADLSGSTGRQSQAWCLQPSVGTWLRATPLALPRPKEAEEGPLSPLSETQSRPEEVEEPPLSEAAVAADWRFLPSVGTWHHKIPYSVADVQDEEPEIEMFADVVGKLTGFEGFEDAYNLSELSPSTCAPDSPMWTPVGLAAESPSMNN